MFNNMPHAFLLKIRVFIQYFPPVLVSFVPEDVTILEMQDLNLCNLK